MVEIPHCVYNISFRHVPYKQLVCHIHTCGLTTLIGYLRVSSAYIKSTQPQKEISVQKPCRFKNLVWWVSQYCFKVGHRTSPSGLVYLQEPFAANNDNIINTCDVYSAFPCAQSAKKPFVKRWRQIRALVIPWSDAYRYTPQTRCVIIPER